MAATNKDDLLSSDVDRACNSVLVIIIWWLGANFDCLYIAHKRMHIHTLVFVDGLHYTDVMSAQLIVHE